MPLDAPRNLRLWRSSKKSVSICPTSAPDAVRLFVCKYKWTETTAHGGRVWFKHNHFWTWTQVEKVVAVVWFSSLPIHKELTILPLCCRKTTWNWWFCIRYTSFPDEIERMIWVYSILSGFTFRTKLNSSVWLCLICSVSHKTSTFDFMQLPKWIGFNRTSSIRFSNSVRLCSSRYVGSTKEFDWICRKTI